MQFLIHTQEIPDFIKIKTYTYKEANGLIYIWHHVDGEEPTWEPEVVPEIVEGVKDQWVYQGRTEYEVTSRRSFQYRTM